ncbi:hypothetical protein GSI_04393 [Ganoderma sinense ZZ0214-1]|uniref:Protein kinase domain-containing protein n=1 Tax=Ganoderma sinense ZZ0214-1 TaxID=1077348 RepID=A0A2G8SJP1_9APHY|nr:hypothetical protein GSI_04393 [Ganoderma sinense ZZ0214-1]
MAPVSSDSVPKFALIETMDGEDDGLVLLTVKCVFAPQQTRIVYVAFKANYDVHDAAENKVSMWDADHDDDADRAAYHAAIDELSQTHIFPLLSGVPRDTLLWPTGGIPTFTLSTVDGSVQLSPGMLESMKDIETQWLRSLPSIDTIISDNTPSAALYDINDVVAVDYLDGGSRVAILAVLRDQPRIPYVAFYIPTVQGCVDHGYDRLAEATLYEMAFLRTIRPHPHVISPPVGYISRVHDDKRVLCGYLLKYHPGGSLDQPERIDAPIATHIKWAYQVASGLHHLHHVAHTYHGDIKLNNVVLDENGDAVIIDLEQGRANEGNAAPELHAASLVSVGDDGRLCYYTARAEKDATSAKREDEDEDGANTPLASRDRPYDIWKDTPRAIEAAEVWAFATALGPLLANVDAASAVLARCRSEDPNSRPAFGELEGFFRDLYQGQALP